MTATGDHRKQATGSLKKGSPQVREREARALDLRKAGLTYREIGERLGVSDRMAARVVHRALGRLVREPAAELLALEGERLDLLLRSMWPRALRGSARHAEVVLRTMERRARLFGLDAPTRQVVQMTGEEIDALDREIEQLLASYRGPGAQEGP